MTVSLAELLEQREELAHQIDAARRATKAHAVSEIRRLMAEHALTEEDVIQKPSARAAPKLGTKVPPKFRDPTSGVTWTGRGLKPLWLLAALESGQSLNDFAI